MPAAKRKLIPHATVIDENAEHNRASYWRRRIMLLRVGQLAELIGYAWREVYQKESGFNQDGTPIEGRVWLRYRMACAAAHARKYGWDRGREFDWRL